MKRAKTACLQITCVLELMQFCLAFKLPDTYDRLQIGGPATAARLTERRRLTREAARRQAMLLQCRCSTLNPSPLPSTTTI